MNYVCLVCGEKTNNELKLCSKLCFEQKTRMDLKLKELQSETISQREDLFTGELIKIWKENNVVFMHFEYPGVTLVFPSDDVIEILLDDIIELSHDIFCDHQNEYYEEW